MICVIEGLPQFSAILITNHSYGIELGKSVPLITKIIFTICKFAENQQFVLLIIKIDLVCFSGLQREQVCELVGRGEGTFPAGWRRLQEYIALSFLVAHLYLSYLVCLLTILRLL